MTIELTEEDLRGLSENERAALMEAAADDADGDVAAAFGKAPAAAAVASPAAAEADPAASAAEEEDPEAEAAAAAAAIADASKAEAAKEGGESAAEGAVEEEPPAPPVAPTRVAPADIEEQRQALNAREDESLQKLLDGETTPGEHAKVRSEVRAGLDQLLVAEATDKATTEIEMRQMMGEYRGHLGETAKLGKAAGLDYAEGTKTGAEFHRLVTMFSNEQLEQGIADAPGNLANSKEALRQAHELMLVRHGKQPAASAPAQKSGLRSPVDRSALPTTLATTPAAVDPSIAGNKFAHLDSIATPAELERALARLTPAEQEEYLGQ